MENTAENDLILNVDTFQTYSFDKNLIKDFRSDHSGEVGAVYIYKGILFGTNDNSIKEFAKDHLITEKKHLSFFEEWLPKNNHSLLIPMWKLAGFMLGYLPAKLGESWVYVTISSVENFVVEHYTNQINTLNQKYTNYSEIIETLNNFCEDELSHLDDSDNHLSHPPSIAQKIWGVVIDVGSRSAVSVSRLI